jgi:hypothetical protein
MSEPKVGEIYSASESLEPTYAKVVEVRPEAVFFNVWEVMRPGWQGGAWLDPDSFRDVYGDGPYPEEYVTAATAQAQEGKMPPKMRAHLDGLVDFVTNELDFAEAEEAPTPKELDAEGRVRLYAELNDLNNVHDLGEILYDERFKSKEWPRTAYALCRKDVEEVLDLLKMAVRRADRNADLIDEEVRKFDTLLTATTEVNERLKEAREKAERAERALEGVRVDLKKKARKYRDLEKEHSDLKAEHVDLKAEHAELKYRMESLEK